MYIEAKYFSTSDYNNFTKEVLKEIELVDKSDISNGVKKSNLNWKLATRSAKAELKAEQDKMVKRYVFDLSYFGVCFFLMMMVFKICSFINQHSTR